VTRAELDELLEEIDELPKSPTRLALLHRAIEAADAHQDLELGYQLRLVLIGTALEIGKGDQLAVAFSWCLAQFDRDPTRFEDTESKILWRFRWVIDELTDYHQVPKVQLESLLEDMTRRYQNAGVSMRAIYVLKLNVSLKLWDKKTAASCLRAYRKSPRDSYSDEPDSELAFEVLYDIECRRYRQAAAKGERFLTGPLLDDFHTTKIRSNMAVPFVLLGEVERAIFCHQTAIKIAKSNPRYVYRVASHMNFLTITDNADEAIKLFTASLPNALDWIDPWGRTTFLVAATFLFERLSLTGDKLVRMRLPENFRLWNKLGVYRPSELAQAVRHDATELAEAFNARSGNQYASEAFQDLVKFHKQITPVEFARVK
jgi:hypothetical protein